jgi:hypothetical protein
MKPELTYFIAYCAGKDAANRNMWNHGRTAWTVDDYNMGAKVMNGLMDIIDGKPDLSANPEFVCGPAIQS